MSLKANFHTHTTFCDGHSTAEEMVKTAIEKGFTSLGFSSHSMFPFSSSWHIPVKNFEAYCEEIHRLKTAYKNKINIYLGFEADYIRGFTCPDKDGDYKKFNPDFLIGSVHYIMHDNGHFTVDDSADNVRAAVAKYYTKDGDWSTIDSRRLVHDYFETEREMLKNGNFNILGHADLIRLRNTVLHYCDEKEGYYKDELALTGKEIAKAGVIVEINTGAIARGNMDELYPSEYFLDLLHERGVPVCINSDAHDAKNLDAAFDRALAMAKKIGYRELTYPCAGSIEI
ncbi:MAG: histidinol-phosphatase [Treponema sp.]|nr:histidinol-phosphatase [Treponema sp.]